MKGGGLEEGEEVEEELTKSQIKKLSVVRTQKF
jgi:hypothetical protein